MRLKDDYIYEVEYKAISAKYLGLYKASNQTKKDNHRFEYISHIEYGEEGETWQLPYFACSNKEYFETNITEIGHKSKHPEEFV